MKCRALRAPPIDGGGEPNRFFHVFFFTVEFCFLAKEAGTCRESLLQWFYDRSDGVCKQFIYSGCEGNQNRFETRQQCENRCSQSQGKFLTPTQLALANDNETIINVTVGWQMCAFSLAWWVLATDSSGSGTTTLELMTATRSTTAVAKVTRTASTTSKNANSVASALRVYRRPKPAAATLTSQRRQRNRKSQVHFRIVIHSPSRLFIHSFTSTNLMINQWITTPMAAGTAELKVSARIWGLKT